MNRRQSGHALLIIVIVVVALAILVLLGFLFWQNFIKSGAGSTVSNFEECKAAPGSVLLETYPEQCRTSDGQTFTGPTNNNEVVYTTYCSPAEKLCFDHRDTWKVETLTSPDTEPGASVDNIRITSPDDAFSLTLTSGISGLGGTCSEESQKDVTVLASTPILALTGFEDEYNQDMAAVAHVVYQNETGAYISALYVTTTPEYAKAGTIKACGTGFSQYVTGKHSVVSADYDSAGAFRFGYTGSEFYGEKVVKYETVDEAKAAFETENYKQAVALMATLRYE